MVGYEVSYVKHVRIPYGAYVQTHESHSNDMSQRTMGAICLGPTGNRQGGHWFLSLTSGSRVRRNHWTAMPMPQDVIARVNAIGLRQKMPTKITYANRYGNEIEDTIDEISHDYSSDDDSTYASSSDEGSSDSDYDSDDYDSDGSCPGLMRQQYDRDSSDSDSDSDSDDPDNNQEINVGEPDIVDHPTSNTSSKTKNKSSRSTGVGTSGMNSIETI